MKTMIRMIAVILSLVLILTMMTACGGNDIEPVDEDVEKKETIEMSLATVYNAKAPQTLGADKFKELIEERSGGSIKVNVFPNGSLGNEKDNYNQLAAGELEMVLGGTQGVDQYASEFAFFWYTLSFQKLGSFRSSIRR